MISENLKVQPSTMPDELAWEAVAIMYFRYIGAWVSYPLDPPNINLTIPPSRHDHFIIDG